MQKIQKICLQAKIRVYIAVLFIVLFVWSLVLAPLDDMGVYGHVVNIVFIIGWVLFILFTVRMKGIIGKKFVLPLVLYLIGFFTYFLLSLSLGGFVGLGGGANMGGGASVLMIKSLIWIVMLFIMVVKFLKYRRNQNKDPARIIKYLKRFMITYGVIIGIQIALAIVSNYHSMLTIEGLISNLIVPAFLEIPFFGAIYWAMVVIQKQQWIRFKEQGEFAMIQRLYQMQNPIGLSIGLSVLTVGGFWVYWLLSMDHQIRSLTKDTSHPAKERRMLALIPFYSAYWIYKKEYALVVRLKKMGFEKKDRKMVYGLFTVLLGGVATAAFLQCSIHKMVFEPEVFLPESIPTEGLAKEFAELKQKSIAGEMSEEAYQQAKEVLMKQMA